MSSQVLNTYFPDSVSAPGETLRDLLDERGFTQTELAVRMGRPQKTISEIMNGKAAITPETALQLELVLGVPAAFWTAREQNYRDYLAREAQRAKLAKFNSWAKRFPLKEMVKLGLLSTSDFAETPVKTLLEFFGVASPDQWSELQSGYRVAFRKSTAFEADPHALAAWLRAGEIQAGELKCDPFNKNRFVAALREIRARTAEPPDVFVPLLKDLCASAGVAVAFVPQLPRSRASGATRWLGPDRALVQLSLRYGTDDHLWFTFFHEAAHILLHGKRQIFLEANGHEGREEEAANRWSADFLIPPNDFAALSTMRPYTTAKVASFAERLGIAPGIVVGRLQHEGLLPRTHLNGLKVRFAWRTE